jgi:predicted nucleic acid-binding protein
MNFFFDTTFFIPFINIGVQGIPSERLIQVFQEKKFTILRSSLVLFEVSAKGTKYYNQNIITFEELTQGLATISHLANVEVIPFHYPEIMSFATFFHKEHSDFIDCLILASAIITADYLVTLDESLMRKVKNYWQPKIFSFKDTFQIIHWREFEKKFL